MCRTLCLVALLEVFGATAWADDGAHAEMAAALAAQADLHPTPLALPSSAAAPLIFPSLARAGRRRSRRWRAAAGRRSDVASLPEVVGDAARLFDPNDPAAIAARARRRRPPSGRARPRARGSWRQPQGPRDVYRRPAPEAGAAALCPKRPCPGDRLCHGAVVGRTPRPAGKNRRGPAVSTWPGPVPDRLKETMRRAATASFARRRCRRASRRPSSTARIAARRSGCDTAWARCVPTTTPRRSARRPAGSGRARSATRIVFLVE